MTNMMKVLLLLLSLSAFKAEPMISDDTPGFLEEDELRPMVRNFSVKLEYNTNLYFRYKSERCHTIGSFLTFTNTSNRLEIFPTCLLTKGPPLLLVISSKSPSKMAAICAFINATSTPFRALESEEL